MRTRRRVGLLAAGLGALVLGWQVAPAGVALYDGVNFPDEPYRYVAPGPGQQTAKQPTVATTQADTTGGTNAEGFEIDSAEQQPQVSVYFPANSLRPVGGATTVTVAATPIAPDGAPPADGAVTGNVYRVTAVSAGQAVDVASGTAGTIVLRAPVGFTVLPVIEYRPGSADAWTRLQTSRVGNDNFEAPFDALGDYAPVLPTHGASATSGGAHTVVVVLAVVAGIAVVALVIVRGVRSIGVADPDPADDGDGDDGGDEAADASDGDRARR